MTEPADLPCCTPLTAAALSAEQAEQVAPLLKALADPVRLRLLSLIAALAGTPLRQAEAAHDWAAALSDLGKDNLLAEIDGGIGDDPGDTIRADVAHTSIVLPINNDLPTPSHLTLPAPAHILQTPGRRPPGDPMPSRRRLLLLQRFLL